VRVTATAAVPVPPAGPSATLVNGNFEAGISGWQKFGGELRASAQANSGAGAGALESASTATKWAYQVVTVEGGAMVEFSGYLLPAANVASAYLRISWYSSRDGSGQAIGSVDSTGSIAGPAGGYAFITTGSVVAPESAASARLRIMLSPISSAGATLLMDDIAFGPASSPPRIVELLAPGEAVPEEPFQGPASAPGAVATRTSPPGATSTPPSAAAAARTATPRAAGARTPTVAVPQALADTPDGSRTPPVVWAGLGAAAFGVSAGAGWLAARRLRR
jgi:hypothetical protein